MELTKIVLLSEIVVSSLNNANILFTWFQGTYAIKPPLPAVGGGEGVGRVEAVGAGVEGVKEGDLVMPSANMAGTWCTQMKLEEENWIKARQ